MYTENFIGEIESVAIYLPTSEYWQEDIPYNECSCNIHIANVGIFLYLYMCKTI